MPEPQTNMQRQAQAELYEIRLKGHLDKRWTDWFAGMTITLEANGDTLLTGPIIDQAALHGLLKKVRDSGIPLRSLICLEHDQAKDAKSNPNLNSFQGE